MPYYVVTASVWSDNNDVESVEAQVSDLLWEKFDDVPACDVSELVEP
ncbi:hypothetical protein SEA_FAYELY_61 [Mycobacterium phage Fayely]|uniref:Uncharacterized protein n=4 Tax=Fromanvirus alma TaxID=1089111 RepID=A0A142K4W9_9CAUD|nr:hypothetical protein CM07_gp45 [Mycobacterium phage Alma]AMS00861.1 hypothetical protein PBI_EIDSMOE_61 [Mycobacterium phage Eidsmoe]AOT26178.1 hypothetical protein SEA_QOBBIT_61 [Mycobacterium phage Qobbit]AVI03769.1 hypothetical protein SEA_CONQUERAGE_61 [Mycobacterium phage Conquerage]AXC35072.1 hypothetical protein SEA_PRIYA_61 [Mycobacterium phage Priya]AZF93537.1 hypothetical protein SEA_EXPLOSIONERVOSA_61 [Mycobacterium phage ExplosioNervosa]UVF60923.1 hypothetical protein SEA_FAYEL